MRADRTALTSLCTLLLVAWLLSSCEPFPQQGIPPFPLSAVRPTAVLPSPTPAPTRPAPARVTPLATPLGTATAAPSAEPADTAWLERAGLGTRQRPDEDADVLRRRAQDEGVVVLYSDSSRAQTSLQAMVEAYPGITIDGYTWSAADIALRLAEDAREGKPTADVFLVADPLRVYDLASRGWLWPYRPTDLGDVLPDETAGGLPVHHWSALMVVSGGAPPTSVDSWWDLTRPEWAGRVALSDPLVDDRTLYLLATMVQRADDMAEAYRAEFGQEPTLDQECADAGRLWIRDLLANQPALLHGDAEVARWVGEGDGQTRLGLCGYEQYIKVRRGELAFVPLWQLAPTAGLWWPTAVAIVHRAPHPQAAKWAVRWLYGGPEGGEGYAPWYEAGYYPARSDVPDPPGALPRGELRARLWEVDPLAASELLPSLRAQIAEQLGGG